MYYDWKDNELNSFFSFYSENKENFFNQNKKIDLNIYSFRFNTLSLINLLKENNFSKDFEELILKEFSNGRLTKCVPYEYNNEIFDDFPNSLFGTLLYASHLKLSKKIIEIFIKYR